MSKSNMLLGLAKGKVGDLVFYRDGGEQRTRTRVIPKNPRTPAQMMQRVKIANVSALYRAQSAVLKSTFTNRPSNQSSYNAFASSALADAPYLTKTQASFNSIIPQPCLLAKGSLQALPFGWFTNDEDGDAYGLPITSSTALTTVGAVSEDLLNTYPNLMEGDKIVFVQYKFDKVVPAVTSDDVFKATPTTKVFTIDSTSTEALNSVGFVAEGGYFNATNTSFILEDVPVMFGYFLSRVDADGRLEVSTAQSVLPTASRNLWEEYTLYSQQKKAIDSYSVGSESVVR